MPSSNESSTWISYWPIRNTPELPRPCPLPSAGEGSLNSTCSWQSPNPCLVWMAPLPTVATPSATGHFSPPTQGSRLLPSKSTTASPGTAAGVAGAGPESTTLGRGHSIGIRHSPLVCFSPRNCWRRERIDSVIARALASASPTESPAATPGRRCPAAAR